MSTDSATPSSSPCPDSVTGSTRFPPRRRSADELFHVDEEALTPAPGGLGNSYRKHVRADSHSSPFDAATGAPSEAEIAVAEADIAEVEIAGDEARERLAEAAEAARKSGRARRCEEFRRKAAGSARTAVMAALKARTTSGSASWTIPAWPTAERRRDGLLAEARRLMQADGHGVAHCRYSLRKPRKGEEKGVVVEMTRDAVAPYHKAENRRLKGEDKSSVPANAVSVCGLQICANPWVCPECAPLIAAKRKAEVEAVLAWARSQPANEKGERVIPALLTLTSRHDINLALVHQLDRMTEAKRELRRLTAWDRLASSLEGTIDVSEVNFGFAFGWHGHGHRLLLVRARDAAHVRDLVDPPNVRVNAARLAELRDLRRIAGRLTDSKGTRRTWKHTAVQRAEVEALRDRRRALPKHATTARVALMAEVEALRDRLQIEIAEAAELPQSSLRTDWLHCLRRQGLSGYGGAAFDLSVGDAVFDGDGDGDEKAAEYLTKWGLSAEIAKGHEKLARGENLTFWDLLARSAAGDPTAAALSREFILAVAGRARITLSNGLRSKVGLAEATDDEIVAEAEDVSDINEIDTTKVTLIVIPPKDWHIIRREPHIRVLIREAAQEGTADNAGSEGAKRAVEELIDRLLVERQRR